MSRWVLVALALGVVVLTGRAAVGSVEPRPWTVPPVTSPATPSDEVPLEVPGIAPGAELTAAQVAPPTAPTTPSTPRAAETWVAAIAAVTAIPGVAVRAYGNAALTLTAESPTCRVGWTTLAGIGAIESGHGSHGGSVLQPDGRPLPPIVGPALDGNGVAAIRATATSTAWHGDAVWDHAVGPMQFIPSTWERWGADGDGDGTADPQDVDDAALAAARYLCAGGSDLTSGAGWWAAVRSYNHSDTYVADVLARADGYAAAAAAASP